MRKFKLFGTLLLSILIISACSIEKRVHQSGYHIVKKSNAHKSVKSDKNHEFTVSNDDLATVNSSKDQKAGKNEENISTKEITAVKTNEIKETQKASNKESASTQKTTLAKNKNIEEKKEQLSNSANSETGVETPLFAPSEKQESTNNLLSDTMKILILILCFLVPPVAVWLLTEDRTMLLISILLWLFFVIPGIVFALYHFFQRY